MRRITGRRVASAVAALAVVLTGLAADRGGDPAAAATTVDTSTVAGRAGINAGNTVLWASDAEQARQLDAVAASGAKWLSLDIDWNHIQSDGPGSWRWNAATDRAVLAARARGLSIIGIAAYSPAWARGPECPPGELHCLPANVADYARFVGAAAARYGSSSPIARLRGSITVWGIWNEPNHRPFAMPKPDINRYAAMLKASYAAIKAADPSATVVTGSTAPAPDAPDGSDVQPLTWLRGLYDRGARGSFDAVGHHPYSYPTNPLARRSWNAFTQTELLYDLMVEHGDAGKRIWGTEAGSPTGTSSASLSEADQAKWVRDYYRGWNTTYRDFTGPLIMFQLRDSGDNLANRWENMGLLRRDYSPKPAYTAFSEVVRDGGGTVTPTDLGGAAVGRPGTRAAVDPAGGYYTVAPSGTVRAYDGARYYGSPQLFGYARGIAVAADGRGYVVLDAFGGVHKFGSARSGALGGRGSPRFPFPIARDIALNPDGRGYSILDGFGGIHRFGATPRLATPYWRGWDIARALAFAPGGDGVYVLDAFGGVHARGSARNLHVGYWRGWDIARDIDVMPDNRGYVVVDGFGGIHRGGSAPAVSANRAYRDGGHANGVVRVPSGYVVAR